MTCCIKAKINKGKSLCLENKSYRNPNFDPGGIDNLEIDCTKIVFIYNFNLETTSDNFIPELNFILLLWPE